MTRIGHKSALLLVLCHSLVVRAQTATAQAAPATSLPTVAISSALRQLSFEEAIQQALAQNPNVLIAAEETVRSRALTEQVASASLPTLYGNGIYTRLDNDRVLSDRVISGANQLSANLSLAVPLLAPPAWARWAHAKRNEKVTSLSLADTRRVIAQNAGRAYLAVIAQKRLIEVTARARDAARAHYDFAHQRFTGGVGNHLDEVRAEQEFQTDEGQLANAQAALYRAQETLGLLVGSNTPLDTTAIPKLAEANTEATGKLEDRRPDVQAVRERLSLAERTARDSFTDYLPLLTGTFQPFYQNPPTLTLPTVGWQAQLVLSLPLFDGALRYGLARERRSLVRESRTNLDALLRQARSEVRAAFDAVRRADEVLGRNEAAARLAHESLDLATLSYRAGATTNLDVIDAERRARDADSQVAIAEDGARQARLDLLVASGRFP